MIRATGFGLALLLLLPLPLPMLVPAMLASPLDQLDERCRLQAPAATKCAVNIRLRHELAHFVRLAAAAVLNPYGCRRFRAMLRGNALADVADHFVRVI